MKTFFQYSYLKIVYALLLLVCLYPVFNALFQDNFSNTSFAYIDFIYHWPIWAQLIFQVILTVFSVFIWTNLARKHKLVEDNRVTIGLFFVLFFSVAGNVVVSSMAIFSGLFFLYTIANFLKIYNQFDIRFLAFTGSILIALASFFYYPAAFVLIAFWIGIAIVRPFELKVFLISMIGFLLPFFYAYCFDYLELIQFQYFSHYLDLVKEFSFRLEDIKLRAGIFAVLLLVLVGHNLMLRSKMVVHHRNQMAFLIMLTLYAGFIGLIIEQSAWYFAAFPASIFAAKWYNTIEKKWILEAIFLLLMGLNFIA